MMSIMYILTLLDCWSLLEERGRRKKKREFLNIFSGGSDRNGLDNGKHHLEEVGQQFLGIQRETEVEGFRGGQTLQQVETGAK